MNSMSDQISDLSDEDQQRFHAETQRSLRKQWSKARNQTEHEHDEIERKTRCQT